MLDAVGRLDQRNLRALARGLTALVAAMGIVGATPPMLFERDAKRPTRTRRSDR
jgi:hypothetical protein